MHLFFAHTSYGITTAASLRGGLLSERKISAAQLSFVLDVMLAFWCFCAFASAASQFSDIGPGGLSLENATDKESKMAAGIAFTFFLW